MHHFLDKAKTPKYLLLLLTYEDRNVNRLGKKEIGKEDMGEWRERINDTKGERYEKHILLVTSDVHVLVGT
jgi:hypothetical protein